MTPPSPTPTPTEPSTPDFDALLASVRERALTRREIRTDPTTTMRRAGMEPDPWQAKLLRSSARYVAVCCSRQSGKTCTVAALALNEALIHDGATCLILSPTERQSKEFLAVAKRYFHALGQPRAVRSETELQLHLGNGSRLIGLPENERGVRTYSAVRLLAIDEAARVSDDLYAAIRPMLAVSGGRLIALSTPFGQRGWFHDAWVNGVGWERFKVTARECPRISQEFLATELKTVGGRWFRQEYECSFEAAEGFVFDPQIVDAAFVPGNGPAFRSAFG